MAPSHWIIGGDGWAYDIGFGGLDHVLATGAPVVGGATGERVDSYSQPKKKGNLIIRHSKTGYFWGVIKCYKRYNVRGGGRLTIDISGVLFCLGMVQNWGDGLVGWLVKGASCKSEELGK